MRINVKEITSRVEGVATMLGAYIESSIKDNPVVDKQLKSLVQNVEKYTKELIAEKLSDLQTPMRRQTLKVKKLEHFTGDLPKYETGLASGFDVRAKISEPIVLKPGERTLIPTGLSFEIPEGFEIQVRPRSGWAIKEGVSLVNTPGTIDADYRGEVKIIVINLGQEDVTITNDHRIAQMVLCPVVQADFEVVEDLTTTDRGEGGFGSTGTGEETIEETPSDNTVN